MILSFVTMGKLKETSLTDYLVEGLAKKTEIKRNGRMWVSQVSGCARHGALAATYHGFELDGATKEFYCEIGNTAEDVILDGWDKSGILLFDDYSLPKIRGLNLGGKVDGIVMFNGRVHVAEIKTCGALPSSPKKAHKSQAGLYSAITGLPGVIFYLSRGVAHFSGELKTKEFFFEYEKSEVEFYLYNALYAQYCINAGIMPNKSILNKNELCTFCDFKDVCWGEKISHMKIGKASQHASLSKRAKQRTGDLFEEETVTKRRNGVFKHILKHSQYKAANEVLNGTTWSKLY